MRKREIYHLSLSIVISYFRVMTSNAEERMMKTEEINSILLISNNFIILISLSALLFNIIHEAEILLIFLLLSRRTSVCFLTVFARRLRREEAAIPINKLLFCGTCLTWELSRHVLRQSLTLTVKAFK